jgi:phosphoenolpyruvate phosphomutase
MERTMKEQRTTALRRLLVGGRPALVAGAHDGLSARIVEEAGFDGIWASGFEISASHGVPDANVLTMSENLETARFIVKATTLPVIADCDTGYGNAVNAIRTVQDYEAAGVAAVCIEDNVFPKRCSFYAGVRRELVSLEEHAGKIRACKEAQRDEDFVVIARTEALIAGWGMEEALERTHAYAEAGADLILIHSKSKTPDEILEFCSRWSGRVPLVTVPTTYATITASELFEAGSRIVIYANHGLRSAIPAMQEALEKIRRAERANAADSLIVPITEVCRLVGVPELREEESAYLPKSAPPARGIILAAGSHLTLGDLVADRPKCLIEIRGRTILERQLETLSQVGVNDVALVRGYRKDRLPKKGPRYVDNDEYADTGEIYSLYAAREELTGDVLVLYGDLIFDETCVDRLLHCRRDVSILVDRSFLDVPVDARLSVSAPDFVVEKDPPPPARRAIPSREPGVAVRVGGDVTRRDAHAEYVGMLKLSAVGAETVRGLLEDLAAGGWDQPFHGAPSLREAGLPHLLQELIDRGEEVATVEIYKGWLEIDSVEDLQLALRVLSQ